MMTKEVFEMVAAIVRDSKRVVESSMNNHPLDIESGAREARLRQAKQFAKCFELRNPRFDIDKFLLACLDDSIDIP